YADRRGDVVRRHRGRAGRDGAAHRPRLQGGGGHRAARAFPRLSYDEAVERYGSDKPDLRFGMELVDVSDIVARSGFRVFSGAVKQGGRVKVLNVKGKGGI